jgi:Ser/Thr protein kinase RdoA (MazF antagonist)
MPRLVKRGTNVNTYLAEQAGKKFVLKVYPKREKKEIQELVGLLRAINSGGKITIDPLNPRVLSYQKYVGFVYQFFVGKEFKHARMKNRLYTFGKLIGDFDEKASKVKTSRLDPTDAKKERVSCIPDAKALVPKLSKSKDPRFQKAAHMLKIAVRKVEKESADLSRCRICLLHLDMNHSNVIYNEKTGKYMVIDSKEIRSGYLPEEIAVPISDLIGRSTTKNRRIIKELIRGYESKIKLRKEEKRLIPFFMMLRKMGELVWLFHRYMKDDIPKPIFIKHIKISSRRLATIISQYDELVRLLS